MIDFIKEYWLEALFSGVISLLLLLIKRLYKKIQQEIYTQKLLKEGMVAILHDRLYQLCTQHIERNEITIDELENLEYLYKSYHALGGNGTGTALYGRCRSLKIVNS